MRKKELNRNHSVSNTMAPSASVTSFETSRLRPMKRHGCEAPFNALQILSYVAFFVLFLSFFFLHLPVLERPYNVRINLTYQHQVLLSVLFVAASLLVATLDILSTVIVPTDPFVLKEQECMNSK